MTATGPVQTVLTLSISNHVTGPGLVDKSFTTPVKIEWQLGILNNFPNDEKKKKEEETTERGH